MNAIGFILMAVASLVVITCGFRESKTTGLYKSYGVYGRISAFFFTTGVISAPVSLVGIIVNMIAGNKVDFLSTLVSAAVLVVIALLIYKNARKKCPAFLRKRLFGSMLVSGLGVCVKLAVFFIGAVWSLQTVNTGGYGLQTGDVIHDGNGNTCRIRREGSFVYIQRPDGSEEQVYDYEFDRGENLTTGAGNHYVF